MATQFVLFGYHHLATIFTIVTISILFPFFVRFVNNKNVTRLIFLLIGFILISHEIIKPFYRVIFYDHSIYDVLPLHICHIAAISMGLYVFTKIKFFFEVGYFFGLSGNFLAIITPDLDFSFPDAEYITYYFGHGLLLLCVIYACVCTKVQLTWWSVLRVLLFAVCLLPIIYGLNIYISQFFKGVNYWYLMITPAANTLLDIFPSPPMHIPYLAVLTVIIFTLIYLPFKYLNKNSYLNYQQ